MNISRTVTRLILGLLCALAFSLRATDTATLQELYGKNDKIMCVTIPKSGTHLLIKCLTLLGIEGITFNYNTEKVVKDRKQDEFEEISLAEYADRAFNRLSYRIQKNKELRRSFLVHLPFRSKYRPFFENCTTKNLLMIRDPRDQLISLASTAIKDPNKREKFLSGVLLDLLEHEQKEKPYKPRHGAVDLMWTEGIVAFYWAFLAWSKEPNFYMVRFENLIGPQGGGNLEDQTEEILRIADHLGIKVSKDQLHHVRKNIFGTTRTFKEGQAHSWKHYFTPKVKRAFKRVPGACQLLIELGYERDCNW